MKRILTFETFDIFRQFTHKVLYIITDYQVYVQYLKEQNLEVVYLEEFTHLIEFYDDNEKLIL